MLKGSVQVAGRAEGSAAASQLQPPGPPITFTHTCRHFSCAHMPLAISGFFPCGSLLQTLIRRGELQQVAAVFFSTRVDPSHRRRRLCITSGQLSAFRFSFHSGQRIATQPASSFFPSTLSWTHETRSALQHRWQSHHGRPAFGKLCKRRHCFHAALPFIKSANKEGSEEALCKSNARR